MHATHKNNMLEKKLNFKIKKKVKKNKRRAGGVRG
jgi:hypothetical protein